MISPYWDDLNASAEGADVFYQLVGDAPNRQLVIEWRKVKHYMAPGLITFQTVFSENSSDIRFNYLTTDMENEDYNSGKSATVGIRAGKNINQVSYNEAKIKSETSLIFSLSEEDDEVEEPVE